jgi:4-aminobutyrate aminotransferase-like enzyme
VTGFSATAGNVGYLREAYHGEPYATMHLCREAFREQDGKRRHPRRHPAGTPSPKRCELRRNASAPCMRKTDPAAIEEVLQSFRDFVALCAVKEKETGEPVEIIASY